MIRPVWHSPVRGAACLVLVAALAASLEPTRAASEPRLFRPLTADPRENQSHWKMVSYVEDWRYGTDVTDSTSRGGVVDDREGIAWEAAAGDVFRWIPLERLAGFRGPWVRYQLGVPAGMFSRFDGSGSLINTDYQFGVSLDVLWRGTYDAAAGIMSFRPAVWTSRLQVVHRSSHLGDEVFAQGSFGRNQTSPPYQGVGLGHPPVKRMDLSYEAVSLVVSVERGNGALPASLRAYAGGETRLALPPRWNIGANRPANFRSPSARAGLEFRSAGDVPHPPPSVVSRLLQRVTRSPRFEAEWLAAADVRWAKPYNFASADNPDGETEVWTPRLWTASPYGREFRHHAASWHAMLGTSITSRNGIMLGGRRTGPEWIVALEWYRGYAVDGQLIDQRQRYHSRSRWVPSVTAHF